MPTPLTVALQIGRLVADAQLRRSSIDVARSAAELYLRFMPAGCSRPQIAEAIRDEAAAAGVTVH